MEKIKCYEFDFGDKNLITENPKDVLDWIESDLHELKDGKLAQPDDELEYRITIKLMTQEEYEAIPDWS